MDAQFRSCTFLLKSAGAAALCAVLGARTTTNGGVRADYIPHHEPFQYYASTANPHHLPPTSVAMIGHQGDQANHQYDITSFWAAAAARNLPAVSFIKAPAYEDGNAGYSNPLLEQQFVVEFINTLQALPDWQSTAVILAWDDSGGWYDHVMPPIPSSTRAPVSEAKVAKQLVPACPRCGTPMVQRVAKQGKHAGQAFWGCTQYPKCTGILQTS